MTDYTIDSFTSGKQSVIGACVTEFQDNMEDMNNSHSSAYSSLTNSTNEISDPSTVVQSPSPGAMSTLTSFEATHKDRQLKKQRPVTYGSNNGFHRNSSSQLYEGHVTDLSNMSAIHDGYNSTASSVSGMSSSGQKIGRSRDLTLGPTCASPTTSASIEIRNIIDDYNVTLKRATKEIKGNEFVSY